MLKSFAGILLFAFMLPTCVEGQQSSGELPATCDNNLASAPGLGKEYDLFKNLSSAARGCTSPSTVNYEKIDGQKADARSGPSRPVSSQQEELDRAACRTEGENAARAARGLQPGEYDLFKNIASVQSDEAERAEQSCMVQHGYKKVEH
jgi:hypothetical protein